jgi:hypothetical protein
MQVFKWYTSLMKRKTLIQTNSYLINFKIRDEMIERSAITSTAVEGVHIRLKKGSPKKTK